ncbi:MAG: hypothetical protein PHY94_04700 [Candidatus Omnitrophica bacterium]|nr:hypothetical protein [Candidatus Omnitrophota bacterium]
MDFYLIGIDYKSASLELREEILKKRKVIQEFWNKHHSQQAAILSTCNRFEIYCLGENSLDARLHILLFKNYFSGLFNNAYVKLGRENVFNHLLRLASGLESQFRGEAQIVEQMELWLGHNSISFGMRNLWEEALIFAKEIRLKSGLNQIENNIATIIYHDLLKKKNESRQLKVVIVGTGKIAQLLADYCPQNVLLYFVSHKHHFRAIELAQKSKGEVLSFKELADLIPYLDALISATSSPHFVLGKEVFLKTERVQPFYLYDLALPRDIDPEAGNIKGIVLKNLDSLAACFEEYNANLREKINLAEYLISARLEEDREKSNEEVFSHR